MVKIFFRKKIILGPKSSKNVIFGPKMVKKWQSQKILVEKFLWVGIDLECFETFLKRRSRNPKFFP